MVTHSHSPLALIRVTRLIDPSCRAEGCLQHSGERCGGLLQPRRCRYPSLHQLGPGPVLGSRTNMTGRCEEPARAVVPVCS